MPKPLTGCEDWLVQPYKTERDHQKKQKKLTALIEVIMPIYNETKLECMYETNKLKMHTTGVPT